MDRICFVDSVNCVALTKNGRIGLSAGSDGKICIWNCHRDSSCFGDIIYTLQAHNQPIRCLALLQNDQMFVTGSDDTFLKTWNVASSRNCGTMSGHIGPIASVSVLGDIFLSSSLDGTVKTWTKECTLIQSSPANSYTINSVCLAQSNCLLGLIGSNNGRIMLIDPKTGVNKNSISGHSCAIKCVTMATDGMWGVSGDVNGTIKVWLIGKDLFLEGFRTTNSHDSLISRIRFSPCEQFLVTVGADGYVTILDLNSCKEELSLWGHPQPINDIVIHRDSVRFLTAGNDRKLKLWHGENARAISDYYGHNAPLTSVAITEEGEIIASGDRKGNIFLWKIDDIDWKLELESELTESISELQFVYKDNIVYLLAGCQDGTVTLWNVSQATLVSTFHTSDSVTCIDTISHKWQAICGTQDGTIYKWTIGAGKPLATQSRVHKDTITGVKYLNKLEPSYIISSSLDGYIHLLEFTELVLLASFCLGESITSIDCNLAGSVVAYSSVCGSIGMVSVSSSLEENILFETGPYLFKQSDKIHQFGEYTQSYPVLTDNLNDINGVLEFSDQFECLSANEMPGLFPKDPEFEQIYLVPRRPGVLAPIFETSDEEIEEIGTRTSIQESTNQNISLDNVVETNLSYNSDPVTSKVCAIL
ncbi:hypothetical protein LOD99_11554 [Oopsacas minuta]|uniref:Uncharacterized protein n=1 Tax=Oopsacas minuta TaxID=111878 RepID=A0AAV7JJT8_9METZ|nr:hypothetical protein LOD99_11554 [Oopsacas minuta]